MKFQYKEVRKHRPKLSFHKLILSCLSLVRDACLQATLAPLIFFITLAASRTLTRFAFTDWSQGRAYLHGKRSRGSAGEAYVVGVDHGNNQSPPPPPPWVLKGVPMAGCHSLRTVSEIARKKSSLGHSCFIHFLLFIISGYFIYYFFKLCILCWRIAD